MPPPWARWRARATSPSSARAGRCRPRSSTGACRRRSDSPPSPRWDRCSTSVGEISSIISGTTAARGVLAPDALVSRGGEAATPSSAALSRLDAVLPPQWSRGNPVDILGDADPERYAKAIEIAVDEPDVDGLLVILAPQDATQAAATAERMKPYARRRFDKPVLTSWMGSGEVAAGRGILAESGIPCFWYPDTAARIFNYMWKYSYNLRGLYETPALSEEKADAHGEADALLRSIRAGGRTVLTELESKQVLAGYGIPVVETRLAASAD